MVQEELINKNVLVTADLGHEEEGSSGAP